MSAAYVSTICHHRLKFDQRCELQQLSPFVISADSTPTYAGTIYQHRLNFHHQREMQQISPFVIPADVSNYILLIVYLMLMHKVPALSIIPVFLATLTLSGLSLHSSRTLGLAYGVLVGISSSLCVLLSANLLLLHEPAVDFKRLIAINSTTDDDDDLDWEGEKWQSMPSTAYERLFWVLDHLGSLRALHWSHGQRQNQVPATHLERRPKHIPSLLNILCKLLLIYLFTDLLKEIIAMDPYFWGYTEHDPPDYIRFALPLPALVQVYRMLVAFATFYIALEFDYTLSLLLFVKILGPSVAGTWGHGWAYRPLYGNLNSVATRGLQGWWGAWWHQCFRFTLTAPTNAIINKLPIRKRGVIAKTLGIVTPFLISGAIHACGSYTMWGETRPINAFTFFALQPVGIALQIISSWSLHQLNLMNKISLHVRKATNIAFAVFWLLSTFPLLADDFAKGGLWLTEPFPISVLQILGLGSQARSRKLGFDYGLHFQTGFRWWQTGLAV